RVRRDALPACCTLVPIVTTSTKRKQSLMRPHPLLVSILAVLSGCNESEVMQGCLTLENDEEVCPAPKDVSWDALSFSAECKSQLELVQVNGPPTRNTGVDPDSPTDVIVTCCY